jgi:hypothetical protein
MTAKKLRLNKLDMSSVHSHYRARLKVGKQLRKLLKERSKEAYVKLALGITDPKGNYSASDHDLGSKILAYSSVATVFNLALGLNDTTKSEQMLRLIYSSNISNLKISVGSEMAMLLRPKKFWVANTRSIWAHLLVKHDFNIDDADFELSAYREGDSTSEMEYAKWRDIYSHMEPNLRLLGDLGDKEANKQGVEPGEIRFAWFDALANEIYEYARA